MFSRRSMLASPQGFGNILRSEAIANAIPKKQNSPKLPPFGLYPELISGSPFTQPRHSNRYCWTYRILPSASLSPKTWTPYNHSPLFTNTPSKNFTPSQYRSKWPVLKSGNRDWLNSITTMSVAGTENFGASASLYSFNISMGNKIFRNSDADMIFLPFRGAMEIQSEMGIFKNVSAGEMVLIPRGVGIQVNGDGECDGYLLENFGAPFVIPDMGPIGISSGLAHPRHFIAPDASFDESETPHELIVKYGGKLFSGEIKSSLFNVVGWYGAHVPFRYDLSNFMAINTVSFDHPDPSIGTVLTSPSATPGCANIDFVIFPSRWMVAENTFRPPWFHRNIMSEFMGLIYGEYDAKNASKFSPGCCSIHSCYIPHGPDADSVAAGTNKAEGPERYENTLAFMWETRNTWLPTDILLDNIDHDYLDGWHAVPSRFKH